LHAGLTQPFENVIDVSRVGEQATTPGFDGGKARVDRFEIGKSFPCLLDPSELGEPGDDITQTHRQVTVQRLGAPTSLDCLLIVLQLVMGASQSGQPDKQARISEAELDRFLNERNCLLGSAGIGEYVPENGVAAAKLGFSSIA
jgi:hypothetical protein